MDKQEAGSEELFEPVDNSTNEDLLKNLSEAVKRYQVLELEIKVIQENLKTKMGKLEKESRETIPTILNEAGLSELRLSTGEKIKVDDKIKPSIANKNHLLAYRNMIQGEIKIGEEVKEVGKEELADLTKEATKRIDSLFKSVIEIKDFDNLPMDLTEDRVTEILLDFDIPYQRNQSIHYQTLKKYCDERLKQGLPIPEGISVFQYQETKITKE